MWGGALRRCLKSFSGLGGFHGGGAVQPLRINMKNSGFSRGVAFPSRANIQSALVATALLAGSASAQEVLFTENFNSPDNALDWRVNTVSAFDRATFGFDYGALGIPPAPNSTDGTAIGLKLEANVPREGGGTGLLSGVSVSPLDRAFTGNYQLRFDLWQNFPGPFPAGGAGSTQLSGGGVLSSGLVTHYVAGGYSAITFFATGDGGSGDDYRVYAAANVSPSVEQSTTYAAASPGETTYRNNTDSYYASFGAVQAPEAHTALFPATQTGTTAAGTQGMKWHDVAITKIGSVVTWHIDDVLIATVDLSRVTAALSGENIYLAQSDINATTTSEALAPLLFGLFDNVRVISLPDAVTVSAVRLDANTISEADADSFASFEISRTGVTDEALTVNFEVTGAGTRGESASAGDYFLRVNGAAVATATSVTIPAGATSVVVEVVPNNDTESELAESVTFNIGTGDGYILGTGRGGTFNIVDNDPAVVNISAVNFPQMYEALEHDRIRITLQRLGDLSAPIDVNLTYAGTAGVNDFRGEAFATMEANQVTRTFDVFPVDDSSVEGDETIIISVAAGQGYTAGTGPLTAGATATVVDDDLGPETVLFADDFTNTPIENYTITFGSVAPESLDYRADTAFDYSAYGIPPAPNSAAEDTLGFFMTVNKTIQGTVGQAAGVNAYPNGQTFSGNYALRFDMYILQNNGTATTEHATFGLNHDAAHVNWFKQSGTGVPAGTEFDGIFAAVISDASASAPGDYVLFSAPTVTRGTVLGPTILQTRTAASLAGVFHNPPYTPGSTGAGAPGNIFASETKSWAQVELSQVDDVVTLKINNTVIFSHANTGGDNTGNIMLGFVDAYDSVPDSGGSRIGSVIYDNVRVVRLENTTPSEIRITGTRLEGGNLVIEFTSTGNEQPSAFKVFGSTNVASGYTEDTGATATIAATANGYRATIPATGAARYFLIRK